MSNLSFQRRFKAEVSNGIGSWLGALENLTQLSIIINCGMVYFTSATYKQIFVEDAANMTVEAQDLASFFMIVILVEHILMLAKGVIEGAIDDVPEEVQRG
jgi:hypothetical protein